MKSAGISVIVFPTPRRMGHGDARRDISPLRRALAVDFRKNIGLGGALVWLKLVVGFVGGSQLLRELLALRLRRIERLARSGAHTLP